MTHALSRFVRSFAALAGAVLVLGGAGNAAPPFADWSAGQYIGLPDMVAEYLAKQPEQSQREVLQYYLAHGIYVNLPTFWGMLDAPTDVRLAVEQFGEPLTPPMLDALERALPRCTDPKERIRFVAWLYRYKRPSGDAALAKELADNASIDAAYVYALNQDPKHLEEIQSVVLRNPRDKNEVIDALGDWNAPHMAEFLLRAAQSPPENTNFALALGAQNAREALPYLRRMYFTSLPDDGSKVYAAAAIVKLEGTGAPVIREYLRSCLILQAAPTRAKGKDGTSRHLSMTLDAIRAVGQVKDAAWNPELRQIVRAYVHPLPADTRRAAASYIPPAELATNAAQALARLHDTSAVPLLTELLLTLKRSETSGNHWPEAATALLQLDYARGQATVQTVMGRAWLRRYTETRALRPLPVWFLPDQSFYPGMETRVPGKRLACRRGH